MLHSYRLLLILISALIIGVVGCEKSPEQESPTPTPSSRPASPQAVSYSNCPCDNGCCDRSGRCKSGDHSIKMPLIKSKLTHQGIECKYSVKKVDCTSCCNLLSVWLSGSGNSPRSGSVSLERSDSSLNVSPPETFSEIYGGWETNKESKFGCTGTHMGCGDGIYTASIEVFPEDCPDSIMLWFRMQ